MTTRQTYVMANWKMNPLSLGQSNDLLAQLATQLANPSRAKVVVFANQLDCLAARAALPSSVGVGVQCVSSIAHSSGAYTGETSAAMCKARMLDYTLVGHSERRHVMAESTASRSAQIGNGLAAGLSVVYCVGELLAERDNQQATQVVQQQLVELLTLGDDVANALLQGQIIIAYEPVWAIGTGQTATADDAQKMHAFIRQFLASNNSLFANTALLYGGSVKASNAASLANCPDIDGVLVGGASLLVDEFCAIIAAFN